MSFPLDTSRPGEYRVSIGESHVWVRPVPTINVHITAGTIRATDDLDTPGDPIPEGPEEPTTDPIIEEEPE